MGQVVGQATAHDATSDDHDSRLGRKHSVSTLPVLHPSDDNAVSSAMEFDGNLLGREVMARGS